MAEVMEIPQFCQLLAGTRFNLNLWTLAKDCSESIDKYVYAKYYYFVKYHVIFAVVMDT